MRPSQRSNPSTSDPEDPLPSTHLFDVSAELLRRDPSGREALLRRACGDDLELRHEAERLLALRAGEASDDTLASRAASLCLAAATTLLGKNAGPDGPSVGQPTLADSTDPSATLEDVGLAGDHPRPTVLPPESKGWAIPGGRKLGRFDLIRPVGSGGFGTVYEARDPKLDRIVAVKVLHIGDLATDDQAHRFLREARNAAQLCHPAIVQVHEFGEHNRVPFIVSDFIDGITLAAWLARARPDHLAAADLVAELAEALDHAHRKGVIHRDIKPSNIMIDAAGRPHIMDFGLAKRDTGDVTMTRQGDILGTPAYMSPEQARGEAHEVDGRSDVYSLGVVLYVLLTGELPFRGQLRMLIQQVLNEEPRAPRSLVDTIPRDLETICLKAMTKEPHQRYATAGGLAADLGRFRRAEPIEARPSRFVERSWKWCKRNPKLAWAFAAVAGAMLLTIAILAASTLVLRSANLREAVERRKAQAGLQLACDAVDRFLTRVGEDPRLLTRGQYQLRKDLLLQAREFYDKILREVANEPRLRAEHGWTCVRLGKIFFWLQDFPEVIAQVKKARAILDDLPLAERDLPSNRELLGRSFYLSGLAHRWRNEWKGAIDDLNAAATISARLTRDHPENLEYRSLECATLNRLGRYLSHHAGRENEGVEILEKCLVLCERLAADHPKNPEFRYQQATALGTLGGIEEMRLKFDDARGRLAESMRIYGELVDRFPMVPDYKYYYIESYTDVMNLDSNSGHPERARATYDKMRPVMERLALDYRDVSAFREFIATGDAAFAVALAKMGQHAEAAGLAERSLEQSPESRMVMFVAACAYSLCAGSVGRDTSLGPDGQLSQRERYQGRAMALLLGARRAGLFEDPIYLDQMIKFSDFEPMKGVPEFDRLLDELRRSRRTLP